MVDVTISGSGPHASAAATDRISASKGPFTPGTKGYLTPALIAAYFIGLANSFTAAQTLAGTTLGFSGNQSKAAWTTSGAKLLDTPGTLTDTTSSGTVAAAYTNVLGGDTIAASAATTFTDYYTLFLKAPVAGSNVTATNKWALGLSGGLKLDGDLNLRSLSNGANALLIERTSGQDMLQCDASTGRTHLGALSLTVSTTGEVRNSGAGLFGWSSNASSSDASLDTILARDAANTIAQRNGTAAQEHRWYNTFTDASNYERMSLAWSSNVAIMKAQNAGTGSARLFVPVTGATVIGSLPNAATMGAGARSAVTDSAVAPVFGATLTAGGAVFAAVISDGTVWRYG